MKVIQEWFGRTSWAAFALVILTSPFPLSGQDSAFPYTRDHLHQLVGVGLGGGLAFWGQSLKESHGSITVEEIHRLDPSQVNGLDRVATRFWSPEWRRISDLGAGVLLGGTVLAVGVEIGTALRDGRGEDALTLALLTSEVALLTLGVTTVTKSLVGRIRPYAYNRHLSAEERSRVTSKEGRDVFSSFFSGHASMAFAAATFSSTLVSDIRGNSSWTHLMWGSTLGVAGVTAYARVRAGLHFPTDVLMGGLVGAGMGTLVANLHGSSGGDEVARALRAPFQLGFRIAFQGP